MLKLRSTALLASSFLLSLVAGAFALTGEPQLAHASSQCLSCADGDGGGHYCVGGATNGWTQCDPGPQDCNVYGSPCGICWIC